MISFAIGITSLLLLQASVTAPRMAFIGCLDQTTAKAKSSNVPAGQFAAFAKGNCASQVEAYRSAMIKFDVKNGIKRPQAAEDAEMQIDDFIAGAASQYARLSGTR